MGSGAVGQKRDAEGVERERNGLGIVAPPSHSSEPVIVVMLYLDSVVRTVTRTQSGWTTIMVSVGCGVARVGR